MVSGIARFGKRLVAATMALLVVLSAPVLARAENNAGGGALFR